MLGIGAPTPLHMTNGLFAELRATRHNAPRLAVNRLGPIHPVTVKSLGDEIVVAAFGVRPMQREDLVSSAPKQQVERQAEHLVHAPPSPPA